MKKLVLIIFIFLTFNVFSQEQKTKDLDTLKMLNGVFNIGVSFDYAWNSMDYSQQIIFVSEYITKHSSAYNSVVDLIPLLSIESLNSLMNLYEVDDINLFLDLWKTELIILYSHSLQNQLKKEGILSYNVFEFFENLDDIYAIENSPLKAIGVVVSNNTEKD